jgi:succinate dehydrogenase/fumarate reductase flavoprotein subunit
MSGATHDVLVIGFGFAGAAAAIAAHDAGAKVAIIEKRNAPGGISVCSAGGVRVSALPAQALAYLEATNGGTTPTPVLAALADGMAETEAWIVGLAQAARATPSLRPAPGNYPFPGHDAFSFVNIDEVRDFDAAATYPAVRGSPAGARIFEIMRRNVALRTIPVRLGVRAHRLLEEDGRIAGAATSSGDVRASCTILATGGFEGAPDIQKQFWPIQNVLSAAIRSNTGDGLLMAQAQGAALWHMWHYHGSYGFRHPDPAYPFGIRLKRLPDWLPGEGPREGVTMSWILLDGTGRRFMNEYEPYMQDTGHRPLEAFDFAAMRPTARPALLVVDAPGRALYPLSAPTWNDDEVAARFGTATPRNMDAEILRDFDNIASLARAFGHEPEVLAAEVAAWNLLVASDGPDRYGRPAASRHPIATPPFSAAEVWPIVSNTQGGPAHDARQRVLNAYGAPIPGLYEAGEIGSIFGHIYMSGGNLAECFVGGRIAGRESAAESRALSGGPRT